MANLKPTQQCPICGAVQSLAVQRCSICGAVLPGRPTPVQSMLPVRGQGKGTARRRFDPAAGEDDLFANDLTGRMWRWLLIVGVVLALMAGIGIGIVISRAGGNAEDDGNKPRVQSESLTTEQPTAPPTATPRETAVAPPAFETGAATMAFSTVTPMPPTPTETPTQGPCIQVAQKDDTVYGMAIRCGHVDMAVVDVILEMNDMDSAAELQVNQELIIPWPTPTPGGPPTETPGAGTGGGGEMMTTTAEVSVNAFGTPDALGTYQNIEPTLRPGMAWHTVGDGETILSIALLYGTNLETLSQINPEVPFLQCDYGSPTGGENCSVMLSIGQQIRVPVPLPTATYTPSPEGTLTPTPTATATFNAPYVLSPADKAHYNADQRVVLRWGGTGMLAANERYLVRVKDMITGEDFLAAVKDVRYELPGGWQPADGKRHSFEWTISIATVDAQNNVLSEAHHTEARTFTWDSR